MFQNINENTIEIEQEEKKKSVNIFSNVFAKENIAIYLISFMLSLVSLNGEFSIFSLSILGAGIGSSIPVLGILIVSLIGNLIKFGIGGFLEYLITALVMIATLFIIKTKIQRKRKKRKNKNWKKRIYINAFYTNSKIRNIRIHNI